MDTIASVASGRVKGRAKEGVILFAGIPYAEPPLGRLRFRPTQPHPGWAGVRECTRFGPAAPQLPTGLFGEAREVRWDEDCLTLSVTTPALDDRRRPVLVWIHGGAFRTGQAGVPWYNGASFATRGDIVTVSLNYRLGALGFAHLAELGGESFASSGVNGILDQIAALGWVRENIAAFGGDPGNVSVAGESAGAMSVGTLLGCPAAAGLFRRAILQSGAAHHTLPPHVAAEVTRRLTKRLGVGSVEELQALPPRPILKAQRQVEQESAAESKQAGTIGGMAFQPTVDGRVLPQSPIEAVRGGAAADVQLMLGTNRHETTLWGGGATDDAGLQRIAEQLFDDPDAALATYRASRPEANAGDLAIALTTDSTFRIPAIRLAEAQVANGGSGYMYLFSWESRAFEGRLGATHALEIPFAFNNLERGGVDVFLGPGELPKQLALSMHDAWIAFIRSGEPNHDGLPKWQPYELEHRPVMEFGESVASRSDPDASERRLWDGRR